MLFAKEDWIYPNFLKLIMYVKSAIPCSEKLESMNYAGKNSIFLAEMEMNWEKTREIEVALFAIKCAKSREKF